MGQNPVWEPVGTTTPSVSSSTVWEPVKTEPQPSYISSMLTPANAVRFAGSTIGDYAGAALAPFTFGAAYPALSFLGGAGSEGIAQYMEGKPLNWGLMATEGALNLIPGPNIPGAGAGLKEIGEYAVKAGRSGAAQGAIGSVPRHIAETGQWELPTEEEVVGGTLGGGVMGTATGAGLAGGAAAWRNAKAGRPVAGPVGGRGIGPDNMPDIDLYPGTGYNIVPPGQLPPGGGLDLNRPAPYTTPPPTVKLDPSLTMKLYELGYSQGDINMMSHGEALAAIQNRTKYTPGPNTAFSQAMRSRTPGIDETPSVDVMGNEVPSPVVPVPNAFERAARANKIPGEEAPQIDVEGNEIPQPDMGIDIDTPTTLPSAKMETKILNFAYSGEDLKKWRAEGWVNAGEHNGYPVLARKEPPPAPTSQDLTITKQDLPSAVAGNEVAINPDGDIQWPERPPPDVIANVEAQGFQFDSVGNIFRKIKNLAGETAARFGPDDAGTYTIGETWKNLKRLLGRDPTDVEVDRAMARQAQPGEETGRVAPFPPPAPPQQEFTNVDDFLNNLQNKRGPRKITKMAEGMETNRTTTEIDTDINTLFAQLRKTTDFEGRKAIMDQIQQLQAERRVAGLPPEVSGPPQPDIEMGQWPPNGPFRAPVQQPPSVMQEPRLPYGPMGESEPPNRMVPGMQIPPEEGGLDVAGLRQRSLFPPDPRFAVTPPDMKPRILEEIGQETDLDAAEATAKYWADRYMGYDDPNYKDVAEMEQYTRAAMDRAAQIQKANERAFDRVTYDVLEMPDGGFGVRNNETSEIISQVHDRDMAYDIVRQLSMSEAIPGIDWNRRTRTDRGQFELPGLMKEVGDQGQPIDADAQSRTIAETMDRLRAPYKPEPRQMDMTDQMKDAEIADYLKREDARPPEMTDLDDYGPSEMANREKSFEQQWQEAIAEAETLGIDWRNHESIQSLQKEISDQKFKTMLGKKSKEIWQKEDRGELGLADWEARPTDPPNIAAARRKLENLLFNQNLSENAFTQENPPEIVQEIDRLTAKLNEFDKYGTSDTPANMEVKGTRVGGGLNNIAVGGADTPVLDMLATALYTRDRPATVINELFQNAADEKKISGRDTPIRIVFNHATENPQTGDAAVSIVVKDFGRGMMPNDLYTIFTDVGKSGKRDVVDASGGFGFAKAAPLLGADYVRVTSITKNPETGDIEKYTFEGNPDQLKNQKVGVPLKDELVEDAFTKTGFQVEVFWPAGKSLHEAEELITTIVEGTPGMKGVQVFKDFGFNSGKSTDTFLKTGATGYSADASNVKNLEGLVIPSKKGTINSDTSDIDVHFELDNKTRKIGKLVILNNGIFVWSRNIGYGIHEKPHLPAKIVADIKPTVEEGVEGYPFGLNRQEVRQKTIDDIINWVNNGLVKNAEAQRKAELQKLFDDLQPAQGNAHVIHDSGAKYTPQERANVERDPYLGLIAEDMRMMLGELDVLFPDQLGKTVKFGYVIGDPNSGGINIPSPASPAGAKEFAILINPLGLMSSQPPRIAADQIAHAILHEFTHNLVRSEGDRFTWKLLQTDSHYGTERRAQVARAIYENITGPDGNYAPRLQRLLQEYTTARGRPDAVLDTLTRQAEGTFLGEPTGQDGVSSGDRDAGGRVTPEERSIIDRTKNLLRRFIGEDQGATPLSDIFGMGKKMGWGQGGTRKPTLSEAEAAAKADAPPSAAKEFWNFPTGATTTMDYSAPGRQGISQIFTKDFWKAAGRMYQGGWSPESFDKIDAEIRALPIHQQKVDRATGKLIPTIAQEMGIKLMEPGHRAGPREEFTAGKWLESGSFLGGKNIPFTGIANPLAKTWEHTVGRPIRGSNRAFTTFLNHLRSNRAQKLMDLARDMAVEGMMTGSVRPGLFKQNVTPDQAWDLNPYNNKELAREIGDFVNTATGRGPLKTHWLPHKNREVSVEKAADILGNVLFSPRNLASKLRMLNPNTYIMASPFVRKQYMKAAISSGLAWMAFAGLAKFAGGDDDVTVSSDPTNSDFGKVRIGDTRMDPGAGFQQFLVLLARGAAGGYTSSVSEEFHKFGEGYNPETLRSTGQRFLENKLNPMTKFVYDLLDASEYKPFNVMDRTAQMAVPLMIQDLIGLVKENPEMLPWMLPIIHGWGTQTYDKDENPGRLVPSEYDRVITGGGPRDWLGLGSDEY